MNDWAPDIPQTVQSELPPFGIKPHWVTFAFSASANRLYDLYNAHVRRDRGDLVVWPTLDDLAGMMSLSRGDKVSPYMRELETGGAIEVRAVTKTGGNGRRYVVTLKVHPPEGFAGFRQSSDWHDAHKAAQPDRTTMAERARGVHPDEPAGREVPPLQGVYPSPGNGGDVPPVEGVVTSNKVNQNKEQEQQAPSARSAGDVRRTGSGSSARGGNCGCAASDQAGPVADEVGEAAGADVPTPPPSGEVAGGVPGQRGADWQQGTGGGRRARKSPFTWELRQQIYAVEALLPAPLREALVLVLPHGHLPNANRKVTAQALETRSVEQLGERAARRWISYGYERDHFDGLVRSPLGVVEELLRPTPYCPAPECEDGTNVHTGQECQPCAERIEQRSRARRAGRTVPTHRPPRLYRDAEQCEVCDRPFGGEVPENLVCTGCRAELDRATAFVTGAPAEEPEPEDHPDHPDAPAGPSAEYRQRREELAARPKTRAGGAT